MGNQVFINNELNELEKNILNNFQKKIPLSITPFSDIAKILKTNEQQVLSIIQKLINNGSISRVGPVFRPHSIGASTLATIAVPAKNLQKVADYISSLPEVNHNYEREHHFNLWFVLTATNKDDLQVILQRIQDKIKLKVLSLYMLKDYYIDLGFNLFHPHQANVSKIKILKAEDKINLDNMSDFISNIQSGLSLVSRPYEYIAKKLQISEQQVINNIDKLINHGIIKRFGVIVRHRQLGYSANAMVVWDCPDKQVDYYGKLMGQFDFVTLCYQRVRYLPIWRYNLFCMIHGQDKNSVLEKIKLMIETHNLENIKHDILFSGRCFKQRGAIYRKTINHAN
jgi:DNA-binding Lrp family transcriptional regulator